jgi:membrane-bound lytic murein transglycosylase A
MRDLARGEGLDPLLHLTRHDEIGGWREDDHAAAFAAFCASARRISAAPPKTRGLGIDGGELARVAAIAMRLGPLDRRASREFFERYFVPHRIASEGFVTGYYEPEVDASRLRSQRFTIPLYRRPADLVEVLADDRPAGWDPELRFARRAKNGLQPYFDRAAIEDGALAGRGLELAWLQSAVDAFFIHVQGSARLRFADGGTMRVGFDGKSGHAYTSIGKLAVARGVLALEQADKDGLEAWLRSHPVEGQAFMRENRSFIFFRETELQEHEGPLGAAGVALAAGRSLAIDRTLHTFHAPIFVNVPELADLDRPGAGFRRLMIAQDTGSAIVGPTRGDIFIGSGAAAGSIAGRIRHAAGMTVLVPAAAGARQ